MDGYDRPAMEPEHPIDSEVRARLHALFESGAVSESEFARRSGTKQPWLHRYAHGSGTATIDEVIRIAAVFAGVQAMPLTAGEAELLRLWRGLPNDDVRDDVLAYARLRTRRRERSKESSEPGRHRPQAKASKARERQKAAAE